jgi:transcriptional regulator with XRE-family HTH domain
MNPIRTLRRRARTTQAELARAGGTSQPTVAAYETGRKSPTFDTVRRIAHAVGLETTVAFFPKMTREERRSLALHAAIADRLQAEPDAVLAAARRNLATMRRRHAGARQLLREWRAALERPVPALVDLMAAADPWSRELRHVTPFAGVLSPEERTAVYRRFAADEARST